MIKSRWILVMIALYSGASFSALNSKVLDYSDTDGNGKALYTSDFNPTYQINVSPNPVILYFENIETFVNISQTSKCDGYLYKVTTYSNGSDEWQEEDQIGNLAYGAALIEPASENETNVFYHLQLQTCSDARILELKL